MNEKCCEIIGWIVIIFLAISVLFGFIGGLMIDYWLLDDLDPFYSEMADPYLEKYTRIRLALESSLLALFIIMILSIPFEFCGFIVGIIFDTAFIGVGLTIAVYSCLIMVQETDRKCKESYNRFVSRFKTVDITGPMGKWYMQKVPNLTAQNYSVAISEFINKNCNQDYLSRQISLGVGFVWTVCIFLSPIVGSIMIYAHIELM